MDYHAILAQVLTLLQQERRLSYRVLKLRLQLDDETLEALKEDPIDAKRLARDEEGKVLVWRGDTGAPSASAPTPARPPRIQADQSHQGDSLPPEPRALEAERRKLTVLFCDLVDSTVLASRLDREELREVIRVYQVTCAEVIQRYDGPIVQDLGDWTPRVLWLSPGPRGRCPPGQRTGLEIIDAVKTLNTRLEREKAIQLAIRLGIHTGVVVVGEMGGGDRREQLALGEIPNVAARIQGLAGRGSACLTRPA